jgi:hypothetical protein
MSLSLSLTRIERLSWKERRGLLSRRTSTERAWLALIERILPPDVPQSVSNMNIFVAINLLNIFSFFIYLLEYVLLGN